MLLSKFSNVLGFFLTMSCAAAHRVLSYIDISLESPMKHIVLLTALLAPYCVLAASTDGFDFDIPQKAKDKAVKSPHVSTAIPAMPSSTAKSAAALAVETGKPVSRVEVKPAVPVDAKSVFPLPDGVVKSAAQPSTMATLKPPIAIKEEAAVAKAFVPTIVAAPVVSADSGKRSKEIYRTEVVAKKGDHMVKASKLCKPTTVAMTFHNVPTQKGPYFHRWVGVGCEADEINFVREGNEQYSMNWKLSYVPADETQTARYALVWKVKGKDNKGTPVDYEARHTFTLKNAHTLSLTNNMAVTLRRVP